MLQTSSFAVMENVKIGGYNMRIVIAPDSFKECLAAEQVASAIARGWRRAAPADQIVLLLADGGEGAITVALTEARKGELHEVPLLARAKPGDCPLRAGE